MKFVLAGFSKWADSAPPAHQTKSSLSSKPLSRIEGRRHHVDRIDVAKRFDLFQRLLESKIAAELNDSYIKLARVAGLDLLRGIHVGLHVFDAVEHRGQ
jgi:hypothetical protein